MPSLTIGLSLRGQLNNSVYSPAKLFAASEQGVWYDPSQINTLYQDSAGTTPITAPAQTVGLMLDKSQGLVLGSELVTNGDFSSGTGWTLTSGCTISGGLLTCTTTSAIDQTASSLITVSANSWYEATITKNSLAGSDAYASVYRDTNGSLVLFGLSPAGTYKFKYLSSFSGNLGFLLGNYSDTPSTSVFDNISVKLIPGNHATQATSTQRPTYGINPITGTRNLLTYTERFDATSPFSVQTNVTTADNFATAPNGTTTAARLATTAVNAQHRIYQNSASWPTQGTLSIHAKANTASALQLVFTAGATNIFATYDLASGTVYHTAANTTSSITAIGGGWYRCVMSNTSIGTIANMSVSLLEDISLGVSLLPSYLGTGKSIFLWGAQLESGSTATAYQKVVSQYEVTEAGVQSVSYLAFDGVDDGMVTNTITPAIDKVQVFAGIRKLSDASQAIVAEMSVQASSNAGVFLLTAPNGAAANYNFASKGTTLVNNIVTTYTSPITSVISGLGNISGPSNLVRVNGAQVGSVLTTQGTGNYLNYPLYIGRRGGATDPFNGRLYSLITRFGANLTTGQITSTESWVNSKTGAY